MANSTNIPAATSHVDDMERRLDSLPALDTTEVVERTLERILGAEKVEAIFRSPESQGLRDWAGREIILMRVAGCLPSTAKGGLSRYVVLECTDPATGEVFAATTGGMFAVAAALRAAEQRLLPQRLRVVELGSASNPGQSSVWLVLP